VTQQTRVKEISMRGHVRRRGEHSWEYIVDVGTASAQRCSSCNRRFWVERKPQESCAKCGGELCETEERRRAIKGGYATRKACQAALNKVLTAVEARTFVPPTRITLKAFLLGEWLPTVKGTLRPTTYASYAMLAREHIIPRLGSLQLQKLTPASINALYASLAENGRVRGTGALSASSVRRVHAVLHRACGDAVRWGRLTVNPVDAADPPKQSSEHAERPVWSAEQLAGFLAHVADDRLSALWRLLAMTGLRRGEALGLQWADVDMEAGSISIRRAWIPVNGIPQMSEPKTKRGRRTIALDPATLEALKAHAARQAVEQADWQEAWVETGFVFTREDGQPLHPWHVSKAFKDHLKAAALPEIPLHGLRHSYATLALSSGVNPRIVSGRLGHSTVALTLDVYSHVLPQQDRDAAERIADLLLPAL
jgi:integrase